jgi:hypothetical protein
MTVNNRQLIRHPQKELLEACRETTRLRFDMPASISTDAARPLGPTISFPGNFVSHYESPAPSHSAGHPSHIYSRRLQHFRGSTGTADP